MNATCSADTPTSISLICLLSDEEDVILEDADGFLLEDFCPEYEDYD